ncbi:thiol-activated cytolysin family protein [Gelidibacter sp.]|uniref:thiol-activated cytolysin family protein n=1 Tax=Gelidibacter sp. TaxID=2018083 RepID=UPI002C8EC7C8|nr:thiol-activated cytolysin family protein [Gelidibacter sp.]HUH28751.1 thiol-activated cytolysin family protein [Gelidibacter sp.]
MNKTLLFLGTLCFLLLTTEGFSQRTPMRRGKPAPKTEQTKKAAEPEPTVQLISQPILVSPQMQQLPQTTQPTTATQQLGNSKIMTLDPKVLKVIKSNPMGKKTWSSEFKVIDGDFKSGDHSTSRTAPAPKMGKFCTNTTLNTQLNTDTFKDFTENGPPDWLKPGIIMNAVQFVQGSDQIEENIDRGPITISNTATGEYEVIDNPKNRSAINRAIRNIQSKDPNHVHGANISYSYTEIESLDELNFKVNGRYSNVFANIGASLGIENNSSKSHHYYLVEFQQSLYSLEVDGLSPQKVFPNNPEVDLSNYVYISKVNYGRKGYFMFITEKSLEDFGAKGSASMNYMGQKAAIESNLEKISKSKSTTVKAFYYGGAIQSVVKDIAANWNETGRKPLHDYIAGYKFSQAEAYPISYEMKNLDNKRVGMTSKNAQTIPTCVNSNGMKLKVTLMQLQSGTTQDGDKIADLGIVQHVRYKANGKVITPSEVDIRKFKDNKKCGLGGGNSGDEWSDATALICGNSDRQIAVTVSPKINGERSANIDNSAIFDITHQEANDQNAEFEIDTFVKEYSNPDIILNNDPRRTKVAIHDVLAILTGIRGINEGQSFFDGGVSSSLQFDHFNGGTLPLRNVGKNGDIILEGPIRARNKGPESLEKAFVWMRFELVN